MCFYFPRSSRMFLDIIFSWTLLWLDTRFGMDYHTEKFICWAFNICKDYAWLFIWYYGWFYSSNGMPCGWIPVGSATQSRVSNRERYANVAYQRKYSSSSGNNHVLSQIRLYLGQTFKSKSFNPAWMNCFMESNSCRCVFEWNWS